jgi:hypothetical protein
MRRYFEPIFTMLNCGRVLRNSKLPLLGLTNFIAF